MTEQALPSRVRQIVAEVFSIPAAEVKLESSPETVENWDSVGHLNLVLALEQEFHLQFSPTQIETMVSVEKIIGYLNGAGQSGKVQSNS